MISHGHVLMPEGHQIWSLQTWQASVIADCKYLCQSKNVLNWWLLSWYSTTLNQFACHLALGWAALMLPSSMYIKTKFMLQNHLTVNQHGQSCHFCALALQTEMSYRVLSLAETTCSLEMSRSNSLASRLNRSNSFSNALMRRRSCSLAYGQT